ncbi:hypothetical protein GCM10023317_44120 [Actinopolymorpha pittospori]
MGKLRDDVQSDKQCDPAPPPDVGLAEWDAIAQAGVSLANNDSGDRARVHQRACDDLG